MNERTWGYILLASGVIIMTFSVISIFLVFTNRAKPITIVKSPLSNQAGNPNMNPANFLPSQTGGLGQSQMPGLSLDFLSSPIIGDLFSSLLHYFLMGFLMSFGYKLATLGVMLLRPIKVKLKSDAVSDL